MKLPARGILAPARRVLVHASTLARLQRELARSELERKGATAAAGAALAVAAGVILLYALGVGLATTAVALALVMDWWLALLILFVVLLVVVVLLALVSRSLLRRVTPLKPEKALEEARLTQQALRGIGGE
ncbi:MAG: phage holin family protein [Gaiellaceae bacterium]